VSNDRNEAWERSRIEVNATGAMQAAAGGGALHCLRALGMIMLSIYRCPAGVCGRAVWVIPGEVAPVHL
jgi:hypothetical protein